jgi:Ca2+-binding RTX toxin-like protein
MLFTLALAASAVPAQAGVASATLDVLIVTENVGNEANDITIGPGNTTESELHISEDQFKSVNMIGGAGCVTVDPKRVRCPVDIGEAIAALHGGNDELHNNTRLPLRAIGGEGSDKLFGGEGPDTLGGNEGSDEMHGGDGADVLRDDGGEGQDANGADKMFGDGGNDVLAGGVLSPSNTAGAGGDTLDGGSGTDTADYSQRTSVLKITEGDNQANDGQGTGILAEKDNLIHAEIIIGGSNGDSITGAAEANTLRGGPGADALNGGGGTDTLLGEDGDDTLGGDGLADVLSGGRGVDTASYADRITTVVATLDGAANDGAANEGDLIEEDVEILAGGFAADTLTGGTDADTVRGNDGNDVVAGAGGDDVVEGGGDRDQVAGGSGNDTLRGGPGNDIVAARDLSKDKVECGPGDDAVVADPFDSVAADCESVSRGTGALSLPKALKVTKKRVVRILVGCPAAAHGGCSNGLVTLIARGATVRAAKFSIGAGNSEIVKMPLTKKQLGRLRKLGKPSLKATARGTAGATEAVRVTFPPKP